MTLQNKCANKLNKRYIVRLYIQRTKLAKDTLFFGYGKKELNLKDIYLRYVFLNSQYAAAIKLLPWLRDDYYASALLYRNCKSMFV